MDTTCIDGLLDEASESAIAVTAAYEGLMNYRCTDIGPYAKAAVQGTLEDYERRRERVQGVLETLIAARAAIEALLDDGHPSLLSHEVPADVKADLDECLAAIGDANKLFVPLELTTAGALSVGPEIT